MTVVARRLWLYGLLLFLPALAVGGLALGLLARERSRLAEREQAARESRGAAVESRALTISENIDLLVGDVQAALMATLLEAPESEPRAFLTDWQTTNPLVRDVFRATAEGRIVWGATSEPLRSWLGSKVPWADSSKPAPRANDGQIVLQDSFNEEQVYSMRNSLNAQQYQRARQEIQEVAKLKGGSQLAANAAAPAPAAEARAEATTNYAASLGASRIESVSEEGAAKAEADSRTPSAWRVQNFAVKPEDFTAPLRADVGEAAAAREAAASDRLTRSGWTPWQDGAGPHLFGWRELSDRTVIGMELRFEAIKARLGEVFPAVPERGEAYALRNAAGEVLHLVGPGGLQAVIEVPLAAAALPGWTVVAYADTAEETVATGGLVFALGAALVGMLVLAILAAGGLLVRQARLSELEAAQKTSFVANVSHELKTPLTTIRLYAELLAEGRVRDEAKRADYLATIGQETQRLGRLVANVLDFSRLEQGKKKYAASPLDLAAELRRLADVHGPRLAAAGLALRVEAPGTLQATTDRDAVEQIVLNLLDNACKYAAEGGEVALRLSAEGTLAGGAVRLTVADRGPGVPEAQRERIFEKFHRVDERLTAEKAGAGLGLSIARQLARGLGGDLRCEAAPEGGALFVLTLPLTSSSL
jgi:signal transduction histidine kinase